MVFKYYKNELLKDVLYEVIKRKRRTQLFRNRFPSISELETDRQIVYIDIKGGHNVSLDCILFKKEVQRIGTQVRVLFEDVDGNEFFLSTEYIKLYVRMPIWSKVYIL